MIWMRLTVKVVSEVQGDNTMARIQYAFGREYLKGWTIKSALREVFQNYIDYGSYDVEVSQAGSSDLVSVTISNDYRPNSLEFLRLGNTSKTDGTSIGHHGEGLKAAFLIFAREDLYFAVNTGRYRLIPVFEKSNVIGETLTIAYAESNVFKTFSTTFHCDKTLYEEFINNIITPKDVLFKDNNYGELLGYHKGKGNIYSGGLFVCNIKGLENSYNIKPTVLKLDRDRSVPNDWDLDYATSKILENYQKHVQELKQPIVHTNYNSREYRFSGTVSEDSVKSIDAVVVKGVGIQYFDNIHQEMINNDKVKKTLDNHPKFKKIKEASYKDKVNDAYRNTIRKKPITLLREFKKDYCENDIAMLIDIDVIIDRLKKK